MSCFSPACSSGNITTVILTFMWSTSWSTITLKENVTWLKCSKLSIRCESFDHVDHLEIIYHIHRVKDINIILENRTKTLMKNMIFSHNEFWLVVLIIFGQILVFDAELWNCLWSLVTALVDLVSCVLCFYHSLYSFFLIYWFWLYFEVSYLFCSWKTCVQIRSECVIEKRNWENDICHQDLSLKWVRLKISELQVP